MNVFLRAVWWAYDALIIVVGVFLLFPGKNQDYLLGALLLLLGLASAVLGYLTREIE